jgi:8-oxo-dGTP diphosphatase
MDTADAYGGVVVNAQGQVLLREPANHFDGYVWTLAKGRPEPGDTPEKTALREVREETGAEVRIVCRIPGIFSSRSSSTIYFLMAFVRQAGEPDWETQSLLWASFEEAQSLVGQTTNMAGRQRDSAVLEAAEQLLQQPGISQQVLDALA